MWWWFQRCLIVCGLLCSVCCFAGVDDTNSERSPFYADHARGWFWYERIAPEPEDSDTDQNYKATLSAKVPAEIPPLSVRWIREHLPQFLDRAIDTPTPDNVRAFLYLQRVMMDKSTQFAHVSQQVVLGDPALDEVSRRPHATFAANVLDKAAAEARHKVLSALAERVGVFFFYRADCHFCHAQAPVLAAFAQRFGFEVMPIALDGKPLPNSPFDNFRADSGQAAALNVRTVPSLFLVAPPEQVVPLSQGVLSFHELAERTILSAVKTHWISQADYARTRPLHSASVVLPTPLNTEVGLSTPSTDAASFLHWLNRSSSGLSDSTLPANALSSFSTTTLSNSSGEAP